MKKEDKVSVVQSMVELLGEYPNFYLTNIEALTADETSKLRRAAFEKGVKLVMVKNTLMRLALQEVNDEAFSPLYGFLKGNTAVMFAEQANAPAKLIKDFTKENKPKDGSPARPELKAAYVQESLYLGGEHLEALVNIKSKEELLGDVLSALLSPIQGVISALDSAGSTIHGLLATLEEREA